MGNCTSALHQQPKAWTDEPGDFTEWIDSMEPFNAVEKEILKETWELIKDRRTELGIQVFFRIFETEPTRAAAIDAFSAYVTEFNRPGGRERLQTNEQFCGHAENFTHIIGRLVSGIDSDLETTVAPAIRDVGKMHMRFKGFDVTMMDSFNDATVKVFVQVLHKELHEPDNLREIVPHFHDDQSAWLAVLTAWKRVFLYINHHMKEGIMRWKQNYNGAELAGIIKRMDKQTAALLPNGDHEPSDGLSSTE